MTIYEWKCSFAGCAATGVLDEERVKAIPASDLTSDGIGLALLALIVEQHAAIAPTCPNAQNFTVAVPRHRLTYARRVTGWTA